LHLTGRLTQLAPRVRATGPTSKSLNKDGTVVKAATNPNYSTFSRVVRVQHGLYKALIQVTDGAHLSAYSNPLLIR